MIAEWLNTTFMSFDFSVLEFYHSLALRANFVLEPIMDFFSIIGDNGYFSFLLAFILILFKKTRKTGFCILFSIGFGALITNVTLKELIARPRPFQSEVEEFRLWWEYAGSSQVSEFSFPSGHVTAAMASMTALCISVKKGWRWLIAPAAAYVIIMMAARNYLMVHYPTDVLGGVAAGAVGAVAAFFTVNGIFALIEKHSDKRLIAFILNFDIIKIFKRSEKGETE